MSALGRYVRDGRTARGLSLQALAARLGYANVDKGARRINALEQAGHGHPELLRGVEAVLGLDRRQLARFAALDEADDAARFEAWLEEPGERALFLVPMRSAPVRVPLPDAAQQDRDAGAAYALALAGESGSPACLVWSRRESYWVGRTFGGDGTPGVLPPAGALDGVWVETSQHTPNAPRVGLRGRDRGWTFA